MITAEKLYDLGHRLGADPQELIPCRYGTKRSTVTGFTLPGYSTKWGKRLSNGPLKANVGMLFGSHSQFIGVDCDSKEAVERMSGLIPGCPYVVGARGLALLVKSDSAVTGITSSGVVKLTLGGADAGELRLQKAYSLIYGLHPAGITYELIAPHPAPVVNVMDLISEIKGRGFEMPELLPPANQKPSMHEPVERSSDAGFWCHCAAQLAESAPSRTDGTVGTNQFVLMMTTGLRPRPQLAEVAVTVFIQGVEERGLKVRGGQERLLNELKEELKRWTASYGQRIQHKALLSYIRTPIQQPHQTQAILVHFLSQMGLRGDSLPGVYQVGDAFLRRAQLTGNSWRYESVRALVEVYPPKTLSRIFRTLVDSGLLVRAENTLPSKLPEHLRAPWMYRCSEAAMNLLYEK